MMRGGEVLIKCSNVPGAMLFCDAAGLEGGGGSNEMLLQLGICMPYYDTV